MPLLRPNFDMEDFRDFEQNYIPFETSEKIEGVLKKAGLPEKHFLAESNNNTLENVSAAEDQLKKVLNHSGASVENASRTIAHVMHRGKFENSRLKAAELVLDLHGIRDKEGKVQKQPIFQFFVKDSAINLQNVFMPVRDIPTEILCKGNDMDKPKPDMPELVVPEEIDTDEIDSDEEISDEELEELTKEIEEEDDEDDDEIEEDEDDE